MGCIATLLHVLRGVNPLQASSGPRMALPSTSIDSHSFVDSSQASDVESEEEVRSVEVEKKKRRKKRKAKVIIVASPPTPVTISITPAAGADTSLETNDRNERRALGHALEAALVGESDWGVSGSGVGGATAGVMGSSVDPKPRFPRERESAPTTPAPEAATVPSPLSSSSSSSSLFAMPAEMSAEPDASPELAPMPSPLFAPALAPSAAPSPPFPPPFPVSVASTPSTATKLASAVVLAGSLGGLAYRAIQSAPRAAASAAGAPNYQSASSCAPFVVHGGGALTRELVARCPALDGQYVLPAWCTNAHAQTLIGQGYLLPDLSTMLPKP